MKSPFTGKDMTLAREKRSVNYRKEDYIIIFHYYICEKTKEKFTSTELDEINLNQVHHQYRDKHNIPFPDEIKNIRSQYDVSASKMSEILGFGINSYRQYEAGEMPTTSNARLIQMAKDPVKLIELIELWEPKDPSEKQKLIQKANLIIRNNISNKFKKELTDYYFGNSLADIYSGYRNPNYEKFTEMVFLFSEKIEPYITKMNKLLFYADFLNFKQTCYSISGARYRAINMGPVPNNYRSIFEYISNEGLIEICNKQFKEGYGEKFFANKNHSFRSELFTTKELEVLNYVIEKYKDISTEDIIHSSHLEKAWKNKEKTRDLINYQDAFDLI